MENKALEHQRDYSFEGGVGDWYITCHYKKFHINHNGIKLCARYDEELKKVTFDTEKKTIAVTVGNPTLPPNAPRIVDLSEAVEFFDEMRADIEKILLTGTYNSVTPNADRTVFEVS